MSGLEAFAARCRAAFEAHPKQADDLVAAYMAQGLRCLSDAMEAGDVRRAVACRRGLNAIERAWAAAL